MLGFVQTESEVRADYIGLSGQLKRLLRRPRASAAPDKGHFRRHHGQELNVCVQWQTGHVYDG